VKHRESFFELQTLTMVLKAFLFTLKERFPKRGAIMIEKGKFALSDVVLMRDIDLHQKWIHWFKPGQRVQMSMIFQKVFLDAANNCPGCGSPNKAPLHDEVEW
jgi:hypothetical protein